MRDIDNKLITGSICNLRLVSLNRKRITAIPISDGLAEDMSSAFRAVFKWTSRRHERIFFFSHFVQGVIHFRAIWWTWRSPAKSTSDWTCLYFQNSSPPPPPVFVVPEYTWISSYIYPLPLINFAKGYNKEKTLWELEGSRAFFWSVVQVLAWILWSSTKTATWGAQK